MAHSALCRTLLAWLCCLLASWGCSPPVEEDFLDDRANLLLPAEADHLRELHAAMLTDFDVHFRLITLLESPADINMTATELFDDLGTRTGGARGLLFLVDPLGRQVRIEVGYDLEQYFPDIFIGYLEDKQMLPFFQAGRIGHGIEASSELMISRLQDSVAGHAYNPDEKLGSLAHYSGGGGARREMTDAAPPEISQTEVAASDFAPQSTPEKTLARYREVLTKRIKDPNLPLFTPNTRQFFAQWVVTDAQQANELHQLIGLAPEKTVIEQSRAVIRFPLHERLHPPYFFENLGDGWQLDFATMSRVMQMNHQNMWHFRILEHPYIFGFRDWEFDRNGFPIKQKQ